MRPVEFMGAIPKSPTGQILEPALTWHDGLDVVKLLMTAYISAEQGKAIGFSPRNIDKCVL